MALGESFPSILAAAKTGADWAWAQIYRDLAGPVTGYLTNRGGTEPEDLASETFLQVARGIHKFTGDESAIRSWVFVIAHRRLQDERRSAMTRPRIIDIAPEDPSLPAPHSLTSPDAEEQLLATYDLDGVIDLLSSLTLDQRDVIMLRIVGEQSLADTAKALGKTVGSVKALQRRALEALHERIPGKT